MPKTQGYYILHEGPIGVMGEEGLQGAQLRGPLKEGGTKTFDKETGGWLGITDKYWAAALIPDQRTPYRGQVQRHQRRATPATRRLPDRLPAAGVAIPAGGRKAVTIEPLRRRQAGGADRRLREQLGAKRFDLLIDWGWFYFITKPLF